MTGPVIAAATELLRAVPIAAAVILGLGLSSGAASVAAAALRAAERASRGAPGSPVTRRRAESLPAPQRPAIEPPREVHLHLYGVSAEESAILAGQRRRTED